MLKEVLDETTGSGKVIPVIQDFNSKKWAQNEKSIPSVWE
jgi:hypothetical protein